MKKNYPEVFKKVVDLVKGIVDEKYKDKNLIFLDWTDEMPAFSPDASKIEMKPIWRIHVKDEFNSRLLLSVFYDIHELASICMSGPYFEIYPFGEYDIERYYPNDLDNLIKDCEKCLEENMI